MSLDTSKSSDPMDAIRDLYVQFHLEDWDAYSQKMVETYCRRWGKVFNTNDRGQDTSVLREFRGIGATTWMIVNIVHEIMQGHPVLVEHRNPMAMRNDILEYLRRIPSVTFKPYNGFGAIPWEMTVTLPDGVHVNLAVAEVADQGHPYLFSDDVWKARLIRRVYGPYAMTQVIKQEPDGRYLAYAEQGELLMELSPKGVEQLKTQRPWITVDWNVDIFLDEALGL